MLENPIVVVDDDQDDQEMISHVVKELKIKNKIIFLSTGDELIAYLKNSDTSPFMILCDINLPKEDGFVLRDKIEADRSTHYKSVPFLFWSTVASERQIQHAYDKHSQGFFTKPSSMADLKRSIKIIIDYWSLNHHPKTR